MKTKSLKSAKDSEKVRIKNLKTAEKNANKIGEFQVFAKCFAGGRALEFLKKSGGKIRNCHCNKGEISLEISGVSRGEICEILRKCGGENLEITPCGKREKFKKRLPIMVGVCVFFCCVFLSNLFVTKVEVRGEDEVLKVHIQNVADDIFPFGAVKTDEKFALLKSELSDLEDIAFFTIEVYQNTVIVNFLKAENAEIIQGETSLLAPENGTLISLSTLLGTPQKVAGDSVLKGDVLIKAETAGENAVSTGSAIGSGVLEAAKTVEYTFPIISNETTYTGNTETAIYFIVGNSEIFNFESEFSEYTVQNKTVDFLLPNVQMITETRYECDTATVVYSEEELKARGVAIFKASYLKDFAYTIISVESSGEMGDETCKVTLICKYLLHFSS